MRFRKVEDKVTHVLKSGSKCCSERFMISQVGAESGGWNAQHSIRQANAAYRSFSDLSSTDLVHKGVVDEECNNINKSFFDLFKVDKKFCHEVNKMFFGNTVNEKFFNFVE